MLTIIKGCLLVLEYIISKYYTAKNQKNYLLYKIHKCVSGLFYL